MSSPYIGEIRIFGGNFPPVGWLFCDGQTLLISEYEYLYDLIGTTYGGDGMDTFALPDLRGRAAVHAGQGAGLSQYYVGETLGQETVTLSAAQIPAHGHTADPTARTTSSRPGTLAVGGSYAAPSINGPVVGGSQPHENRSPYLGVHFIISVDGVYPSQT